MTVKYKVKVKQYIQWNCCKGSRMASAVFLRLLKWKCMLQKIKISWQVEYAVWLTTIIDWTQQRNHQNRTTHRLERPHNQQHICCPTIYINYRTIDVQIVPPATSTHNSKSSVIIHSHPQTQPPVTKIIHSEKKKFRHNHSQKHNYRAKFTYTHNGRSSQSFT